MEKLALITEDHGPQGIKAYIRPVVELSSGEPGIQQNPLRITALDALLTGQRLRVISNNSDRLAQMQIQLNTFREPQQPDQETEQEEESTYLAVPLQQLKTDFSMRTVIQALLQEQEPVVMQTPDQSIQITQLLNEDQTIKLGAIQHYPIIKPLPSWLIQYPDATLHVDREGFKVQAEKLRQQQAAALEADRAWWERFYLEEEQFESESTQISKLFRFIKRATRASTNSPDITIPRDDLRNRVFIALDPIYDQNNILAYLMKNKEFTEFSGYDFRKNSAVDTRNFVLPLLERSSTMPSVSAGTYKDIQRQVLDYLDFLIANPDILLRSHTALGIDTTPAEIVSEVSESRDAIEKKFNLRKFEFFVVSCLAPGISLHGRKQPALRLHLTQSKEISESKSGVKNLRLYADEGFILL